MLPPRGAVAGIDVGFSPVRRSSAVCRLAWDERSIDWEIQRYRATDAERDSIIGNVIGGSALQAIAIDGPLRTRFDLIGVYRTAEGMLTRRLHKRIGKPGQSSAPVGRRLNEEANKCAQAALRVADICSAKHGARIDERCVVEAFPSSFLGLMLVDPDHIHVTRSKRSDKYFSALRDDGTLLRLLNHFIPGRSLRSEIARVCNHDDMASFVCALTALCVACDDYCAVGDDNGWIILPPHESIQVWARELLDANASEFAAQSVGNRNPLLISARRVAPIEESHGS